MAEDNEKTLVQTVIPNIGVTEWISSLAAVINGTWSYANSTLFAAVVAGYYRDYCYRYILPCVRWLDGYVPELHNNDTGIISTRIASKLISGTTKQICGESLVFRLKSKKTEENMQALRKVSDWATEQNIHKAIKNGVGYSLGIGTSLVKINRRMNGDFWWEPVRFDNCFYLASFTGEIKEATFYIRNYTDTRNGKNQCQYFLCEHRFWDWVEPKIEKNPDGTYKPKQKKELKAMVEYQVHRATSQSLNNLMAQSTNRSSIGWEEIPSEIRTGIKQDYSTIRINEPQLLGLPNLGVEAFINGEGDLSVPTGSNFGESMIIGIQDDLITYEVASAYLLRDMANGKGTVYVPKALSIGDVNPTPIDLLNQPTGQVDSGFRDDGSTIGALNTPVAPPITPGTEAYGGVPNRVETLKGVNPEDQKALVEQFEVRAIEWQTIKENCLKNIAVKWGMSPKILASFLAQGTAQMTATQIDSEDDLSIAFINLHRSYFKNPINKLLETTLNAMGYEANIEVKFASPSLINKDRLLERILKMLEAGLIDLEEAIRELNPDLDEEALQTKIDAAKKQQELNMLMGMNQMNEIGGGFGPEVPELDAFKGSTIPR